MPVRPHAGKWEARVQHAGRRISRTFATRRDALEWERRYRSRVEDHRVGRTPRYTLEEALARWLTGEARALKSHADLVDKVRTMYPFVRGHALDELVDVAEALKREALARHAAPATVNRKLAILRRVANLAHRQWNWLAEPLGGRVELLAGERQRHRYLTPAELKRLLRAARAPVRAAILLAAATGLRRGELLALEPRDRRDDALYLADSKSGRPRVVPLPAWARDVRLPIGLNKWELRNGFDAARARAKLEDVRFHDLRHSYASWLVQAGAPLVAVRDLLGHSTLAVTGRYAHVATAHLEAAVGRLPAELAGMARGRKSRKKAA